MPATSSSRPWARHPAVVALLVLAGVAVWGRVLWAGFGVGEDEQIVFPDRRTEQRPPPAVAPWPDGLRDPFTGRGVVASRPSAPPRLPSTTRRQAAPPTDPFPFTLRGVVGETALLTGPGGDVVARVGVAFEGPAGPVRVTRVTAGGVTLQAAGRTRRLVLEEAP